jgi:hypothetical protein
MRYTASENLEVTDKHIEFSEKEEKRLTESKNLWERSGSVEYD